MTNRVVSLVVLATALALAAPAARADEKVTLQDVLRWAADRPAAAAATDQARAAENLATAERRRALLPSISVSGSAEQRSRELTLDVGMATLEVGKQRRFSGQVTVRQPILDPARLLYSAPAARTDAKAAQLSASRTREVLAAEAAGRYFDVLEIDARLVATNATVASLESRLAELDSLVAEGRAIDRDRRRLRLALDDAKLAADNLGRTREVATLALGLAIGRDGPVEPAPLSGSPPTTGAELAVAGPRLDVAAIELQREATLKRRSAVNAELIPSLTLDGAWVYDDGLFADQDNFFVISLNLRWTPLAAGTRSVRRKALAAQASALARQGVELRRRATLEVTAAAAEVESAEAALVVATRGVEDALEARRVTTERYRAGRETISDLLEVEALVRDRQTATSVAQVAVQRAQVGARLVSGTLLK